MMLKKISLVMLLLVAFACEEKATAPKSSIASFKDYIYSTTRGVISKEKSVKIYLTKDVNSFEVGSELPADIFQISPKSDGKLVLKTKKLLVFQPANPLKPNTRYTCNLSLEKLFENVPGKHKKFFFYFNTIKPNFTIKTKDLQSYSTDYQYIQGEVKTADVMQLQEVQKIVNANQQGRKLKVNWYGDRAKKDTYFEFVIDSIKRQKEDSEISFSWDGKPVGVKDNTGTSKIKIPGKNNFSVLAITVSHFPEQHLRINFSDPLLKNQNIKGLVTLSNGMKSKFLIDGNILKVYPSKRVAGSIEVNVFTGIKNESGHRLRKGFSEKLLFEQIKPAVKIISNGLILPDSKNLNFNFKAVNLKAVDVKVIKLYANNILDLLQGYELNTSNNSALKYAGRPVLSKTIPLVQNDLDNDGRWKNYAIALDSLVKSDPGALYRIQFSIRQAYSLYNCKEDASEVDYTIPERDPIELAAEKESEAAYWDSFNNYYDDDYYYDYNWRDRDNPCTNSYFYNGKKVASTVLASNIGVITKNGNNNDYFFAITDLLTTAQINNAKIELYNFQKQLIATGTSNDQGIAKIQSPSKAAFAVVSNNNHKTYLKLNEGNALSLSKFNVSGRKITKGLKGVLYGERGVWRPGDTIHTFFVLNDAANRLPKGHPVKINIADPNGKIKFQKISTNGVNGFYRFDIPTSDKDATGNWNATVKVGGATFYKTLKVETVKPNRLKIKIDFKEEVLKDKEPIDGAIQVNWLHGAIAKNLKTEVKVKINASGKGFKTFPGYVFNDPVKHFSTEELTVFEGKVNQQGQATIHQKINLKNTAPGKLNVTFLTRVFENGGDFSSDVVSKDLAPFTSFVGLKSPVSKRYGNSYVTGENTSFAIATVDENGKPIARKKLLVKLYKLDWSWWWSSSSDNLARYVNTEHRYLHKEYTVNTNQQGTGVVNVNIPNNKSGRYLIRITDPVSGHSTGRTAYFFRDWYGSGGGNSNMATMLVFNTDKKVYNVGDIAEVTFPSSEGGNALVSIENGTEVIETFWVKTTAKKTTAKVAITAAMSPNAFINISLLQPHASSLNDMPLRMYGVIPLIVVDENTKLKPTIEMPEELKPETTFEVKVGEANGKAMTYSLAVVEDGLLDLTRFKTPDLWSKFNVREALGVRTWDVFDDVIGAFGGAISQVFAIGGDEGGKDKKATKANRFKPVVKVLGPFVLEAGETNTHRVNLPNYIGSVRTMVVAGDQKLEAYGKAETTTPVRKSLMVLSSLPRKLSPKEQVTLPVTVFAMKNNVKNVEVSVKTTKGITVKGEKSKFIVFEKPDEKMVYFNLEVEEIQGVSKVVVQATSAGEKASQEVELQVMNPNQRTYKMTDIEISGKQQQIANFTCIGERGTNEVKVEISTLPPMNFSNRLDYLIRYPHGCVEQTTSSVFPQLFLEDIFDLSSAQKLQARNNIEKGLKRLANFQMPGGGLSYWMGGSYVSDWGTTYAGHFALEAKNKGYAMPVTFIENWLRYQKQAARNWRGSTRYWNSGVTQAYRLYTLALAGAPDLAAMNRLREYPRISNSSKWRLAAAYAIIGQKEAAQKLIDSASLDFSLRGRDYYSFGSTDRNRAMALETMLLLDSDKIRETAKIMAKNLSSKRWMSTQTTAYSLLSMAKMVSKNGGKQLNVSYTINGKKVAINTREAIVAHTLPVKEGAENKFSIENTIDNTVFVRIINSGILPLGSESQVARNFKLYVEYVDNQGKKIKPDSIAQGTDFVAKVTLTNPNKEKLTEVALTEVFPSGWEIVNTRFTDFGDSSNNVCDFTDIRDDRVNFYFSIKQNEVKTFTVRLNAAYLGKYYLPGVQAEAMYDNDYFARTKGQWISVVK